MLYNEPFEQSTFYDIGTKNIKTINQVATGGAVAFISVGPDPKTIQYERTVYSLFDLFGYLGGLYDFMLFIGFWLVNTFQDKIFYNSLISSLYQVKPSKDKDEFDMISSMSALEETKRNWQTQTLNTSSSMMFRSKTRRILPNVFHKPNLTSSLGSFEENYGKFNAEELKDECSSRRLYSFNLHNICCPLFK